MLSEKINEDLKAAMKSKDTLRMDTLRMLKAAVNNYLIEKKKVIAEDPEILTLIQKQVKLRLDSIESYKKGGRQDLAQKEAKEQALLEVYLPKPLSDAELTDLVKQTISRSGAKTKADVGRVMKEAVVAAQGRADGKRINQIALSLLQ